MGRTISSRTRCCLEPRVNIRDMIRCVSVLTDPSLFSVFCLGFALANELKRLPFSRLGGAGFPADLDG